MNQILITACGVLTTPTLYPAGRALVNSPVAAAIISPIVIPDCLDG